MTFCGVLAMRRPNFQRKHQPNLQSIAAEITESLGIVNVRRKEIAVVLADIARGSQHVGMQIGQGVMALQIGDSTRQRIEHVHQALHLAADALETPPTGVRWANLDVSQPLNSFLEQLEKKLKAARDIIDDCRSARAIVDQATNAVVTTMADLNERTAGLSEIVIDMTIIGTNAILKSSRLGQRGKGLNVIAQELRDYASRVVQGIKGLPAALQEVISFVESFSEAGSAHNASHLTALGERMTAAIGSFELSGARMSSALTRLDEEAEGACSNLKEAVARLSSYRK
jgi:hypothetical protein